MLLGGLLDGLWLRLQLAQLLEHHQGATAEFHARLAFRLEGIHDCLRVVEPVPNHFLRALHRLVTRMVSLLGRVQRLAGGFAGLFRLRAHLGLCIRLLARLGLGLLHGLQFGREFGCQGLQAPIEVVDGDNVEALALIHLLLERLEDGLAQGGVQLELFADMSKLLDVLFTVIDGFCRCGLEKRECLQGALHLILFAHGLPVGCFDVAQSLVGLLLIYIGLALRNLHGGELVLLRDHGGLQAGDGGLRVRERRLARLPIVLDAIDLCLPLLDVTLHAGGQGLQLPADHLHDRGLELVSVEARHRKAAGQHAHQHLCGSLRKDSAVGLLQRRHEDVDLLDHRVHRSLLGGAASTRGGCALRAPGRHGCEVVAGGSEADVLGQGA
mmetsp:Transcript_105618/g.340402  ORF Transcript_105618/g.340402 Transcript_105618/m.340402 type:complete len:383 (+) Transcript_105618:494-1642(+)